MVRITCSQMSAGNSMFTGREKYNPNRNSSSKVCAQVYIQFRTPHFKKNNKGESELDGGQH